ncbi:hypothetical protein LTR70_002299 [Exophiala xenobiotica]|uniref:Uncharacterized protein n=1 Tax=Lithohypha guttulata TaxID=1690604 RepID=A0ABR0KN58_9EURO|nr:hypothetical protein LTR24_001279 [Lithohypha guttulata]KAK5326034.1 hypothetical protein LTR70_002299 [Exophiala xenobiotica]
MASAHDLDISDSEVSENEDITTVEDIVPSPNDEDVDLTYHITTATSYEAIIQDPAIQNETMSIVSGASEDRFAAQPALSRGAKRLRNQLYMVFLVLLMNIDRDFPGWISVQNYEMLLWVKRTNPAVFCQAYTAAFLPSFLEVFGNLS